MWSVLAVVISTGFRSRSAILVAFIRPPYVSIAGGGVSNWLLVSTWGAYLDLVLCVSCVGYAVLFYISWWIAATCSFSFAKIC